MHGKYCNRKHIRTFLLCMLVTAALLSGCSFTESGQEIEQTPDSIKIDFSWWGNDARHFYTMDGVDLFHLDNPSIEVDYRYGDWNGYEKRTKVWMESHTEADVMQINYAWLFSYSKDGNGYYDLYQLADYIDLSQYSEDDLAFGEMNGKLNAIPIAFNTSTIYCNKDIYDRYGLELPASWEDYFEAAKAMREDGIYPIGMAKKQLFLFLLAYYEQTSGEYAFSSEGELLLTEEDVAYMLDFYRQMLDEKVLMPVGTFSANRFADGQVAASMFWISDADNYCGAVEKKGGNPVIAAYPMVEDAKLTGWYMKPATMYAISNITQQPEAAARLLDYLVNSSEMALLQKTEKGVPASHAALETLEQTGELEGYGYEANVKMVAERDKMNIMLPIMENEELLDAFKSGADEYLYGKVSREDCAKDIYQRMKSLVEAAR